jgi:hypothetical protein
MTPLDSSEGLTHQDRRLNILYIPLAFTYMEQKASQVLDVFFPDDIFATEHLRAEDRFR